MRWRRLCVDLDADGEVLSSSIEWHPDITEEKGPEAITVRHFVVGKYPQEVFLALLAEPWYQPALPFPEAGRIIVDAPSAMRGEVDFRLGKTRER